MSRIKQLSYHEAQKIAAGEVVERPANVVKELVENSLDAGSTTIAIHIEEAGKKLIRIVDNGSGMDAEDAHMSIKHHTTSKISSVDDLASISTFGFRGEALSSISSVSKVTLTTKEETGTAGITLTIYDSAVQKESPSAANKGTDISVEDLFYNVPVRRKFLKTRDTEWRAIVQLFHAFCFSYQNVHFKLFHDGKLVYNCPATNDIITRLGQLFDSNLVRNVVPFEAQYDRMNVKIHGALSNNHYTRYDRNHIFLFVNNRWIKNHKLVQAFIKGYKNSLQPNMYPVGFLFITIDPEFVDINIHPRKEEVQFLHPKIVEDYLTQAVEERLNALVTEKLGAIVKPYIETYEMPVRAISEHQPFKISYDIAVEHKTDNSIEESAAFSEALEQTFDIKLINKLIPEPDTFQQISIETHAVTEKHESHHYTLIGQSLKTYILIETNEGITIIDQHAAHERILYERFKNKFHAVEKSLLLFPQVITLNKEDIELAKPYLELFEPLGLSIEIVSAQQLLIRETPLYLKNQSVEDIIHDVISCIHKQETSSEELKKLMQEKIHAQMSCKAAVKAGDILSPESMHEIIKDLLVSNNKMTCPHGRPTLWQIHEHELKKKFKRDYRY